MNRTLRSLLRSITLAAAFLVVASTAWSQDLENTLFLELKTGRVTIEMRPVLSSRKRVFSKGRYVSWDDFAESASETEIAALVRAVGHIARQMDIAETGYRALVNTGDDGRQEVPHFHVHIFGGAPLGRMIKPAGK